MISRTPNFTGWRVVILAEEDANTERLRRQLALLGIVSSLQWLPLPGDVLPDLVIVDADRGWDELLPLGPSQACASGLGPAWIRSAGPYRLGDRVRRDLHHPQTGHSLDDLPRPRACGRRTCTAPSGVRRSQDWRSA